MPLISLFAACLLALAGCGDETEEAAPVTGVTGATGQSATPATAAEGEPGDDGGAGVQDEAADPGSSGDSEQGDEEGARTPVEITVSDGGFSAATPSRVHVPAFIAIELDVTVKDARGYRLTVVRGAVSSEHAITGDGHSSVMLEGLRPGRSLDVKLGGDTVEVTADAEPGP